MSISGVQYELGSGAYRATISEVGATLAGLSFGDRSIVPAQDPNALPPMSSGAVLLPWPNRIADGHYAFGGTDFQLPLSEPAKHNASHGLTRWVRWLPAADAVAASAVTASAATTDAVTASAVTLEHVLVPQTGYPFELHLQVTYALDADRGLSVRTEARNVGERPLPFGAGFHPYLDLDGAAYDEVEVQIPAETVLIANDRQIPTGQQSVAETPYDLRAIHSLGALRLDHGFTDLVDRRAHVRAGGNTTELWWDESFHYLQVFTPEPARFGRTALAIEPMTCPANAFNSGDGLIILEPDQTWTGAWGIIAL